MTPVASTEVPEPIVHRDVCSCSPTATTRATTSRRWLPTSIVGSMTGPRRKAAEQTPTAPSKPRQMAYRGPRPWPGVDGRPAGTASRMAPGIVRQTGTASPSGRAVIHRSLNARRDVQTSTHPATARSGAAASSADVHRAETTESAPSPGCGPGPAADGRGGPPAPARPRRGAPPLSGRPPGGDVDACTTSGVGDVRAGATSCRHEQCGPRRSPPAPSTGTSRRSRKGTPCDAFETVDESP
jgi:hypothetical protein